MPQQQEITNYYNKLAEEYDNSRFANSYGQFIHHQENLFIKKHWGSNSKNTLDLACGTGRWTHLTNHGVDISPAMLTIAKQKHPNVNFHESTATDLPFENQTIGATLSMHLMMHLDQETLRNILKEVKRVTAPNGIFIFDFPSKRRRVLFNKNRKGWHGSFALTIKELKAMLGDYWKIEASNGVLFFPIHRVPKKARRFFMALDTAICRSFLKHYASYIIIKLRKVND